MSKNLLRILYFWGKPIEIWKHLQFYSSHSYNTFRRFQLLQLMSFQQSSLNAEILTRGQAYVTKYLKGRTEKTTNDLAMKTIQLGEGWRIFASRNRYVNQLYAYYVFRKGSVAYTTGSTSKICQMCTTKMIIFGSFSSVTSRLWQGLLISWNVQWLKKKYILCIVYVLLSLITSHNLHAPCFKSIASGPNLPRIRNSEGI